MKSISIQMVLSAAFLLCVLTGSSQEQRYDAQYGLLLKEYTLNPDGSTDFRIAREQKLLTYRAFHNLYGETFVVYNPQKQQLKINECHTIMADGRKIPAPENAFNEVLPGNTANAPFYNALREMVITHTGLERNATIHLDYTVHTLPGVLPGLWGNELLAENEPVSDLRIRILVPAGRKLFYRMIHSGRTPEITTEGKFTVYQWKFDNQPALSAEESQPGGNERYPRLIFSTFDKADEAFSVLTRQPAFSSGITDEMKKAVSDAATGKKERFETALKLQEMVVNDMRLYGVPLKAALYSCRTPEETWRSNGGTVLEKALLLAALLREAGMEASVAGVVRTAFLDEKVPVPSDLEDFAVVAETRERGKWFFSVTALNGVNLNLTLPGRSFVLFEPDGGVEVIKAREPSLNVRVSGEFLVSSDPQLTGELSLYCDGSAYPMAGQMRDRKRLKNSLSGGLVSNDTAHVKTSTLNAENGFQSYIAKNDKPFRKDSSWFYFTLPASSLGVDGWNVKTLSGTRGAPFEIPARATETYAYTLKLPAGMTLVTPVKKTEISNTAGAFLWEVETKEGVITVKREIRLKDRIYEKTGFEEFKALMDAWNSPWMRQLVFTRETK